MPAISLTANSPALGSIAWGAFTIQYRGIAYPIAAGSTANKFVWWKYNGGIGSPLQSGNAAPGTIGLTDDDLLLFLNKNGIPVNAQTGYALNGDLLVEGSVLATAIGANQIQTRHLSIGDTANLVADPQFTETQGVVTSGVTLTTNVAGAPAPRVATINTTATSSQINPFTLSDSAMRMNPLEYLDLRAAVNGPTDAAQSLFLGVKVYSQDLQSSVDVWGPALPGGPFAAWAERSVTIQTPATVGGKPSFYGVPIFRATTANQWAFTNWAVRRKNAGSLIVDGTIYGNMLDVAALNGKLITGPIIQTSAAGPDRLVLDTTGFRARKAGTDGVSIEILPSGDIVAYGDDSSGGTFASLGATRTSRMTGGQFVAQAISSGTFAYPIMTLGPNSLMFAGSGTQSQSVRRNAANEGLYVETSNGPIVIQPNGVLNLIPLGNNDATVQTSGSGSVYLNATGSGNVNIGTTNTVGEVRSLGIFDKTTASAANVRIETAGALRRVSSSRRYKTGIRNLSVEDLAIFGDGTLANPGLRAVTFYDKASQERYANDETGEVPEPRRIPGVIAEEVHDLGLGILVEYNDDGEPETVSYDRFLPVLLPAMQRDHERIQGLVEEVAELRDMITSSSSS